MKGFQFLKRAALSLACAGILVPQVNVQAATPEKELQPVTVNASQVIDVSLSEGGVVKGQVLDVQGKALDGAAVSIRHGKKEVAKTVTDANGNFAVKNLRAGTHQVVSANGVGVYRFWAENTAPPQARKDVLVVSGHQVVRGQLGGVDVITLTTVGVGIATLTYVIINHKKLKDLECKLEQCCPKSP